MFTTKTSTEAMNACPVEADDGKLTVAPACSSSSIVCLASSIEQ